MRGEGFVGGSSAVEARRQSFFTHSREHGGTAFVFTVTSPNTHFTAGALAPYIDRHTTAAA